MKVPSTPNPTNSDTVISSDISIDSSRNFWFRLYTPSSAAAATSLPVLIFFHGGGFAFQSAASKPYDVVCRKLARSLPAIVISVNYRVAPEHRYPCQYDDGFNAVKFIDNTSNLPLNADLSHCFLIGDSAGGNIAHEIAIRACQERFRILRITGLIAIQPFFGGEERTESEIKFSKFSLVPISQTDWFWKVFLPEGENRDHPAVNVSGPNGVDISGMDGFPSTVVIVGGLDTLQDWQRRYYQWLLNSGKDAELVELPNMIHGFYCFPDFPETSQLFEKIKEFVAKVCFQSETQN